MAQVNTFPLQSAVKIKIEMLDEDQECPFEDDLEDNSWNTFIYPKELIGGLQLLSNEPSFFTIKAARSTAIARIDKDDFDELSMRAPGIVLPVAYYSVIRRLSSFIRAVDFAIDWARDLAESIYVVLSGRLRSVSNKVVIEEFGRTDVVGILEMLQRKPRSTTVLAVRYSQLARVPEGLLNFVKINFPQVGFRLVVFLLSQLISMILLLTLRTCTLSLFFPLPRMCH
uniref:Cyclic nucleotide-binding domain-containing protein n=1 Tax=Ditylenchus dipsaci TaxID=166011 RepID=A0A915CQA2_9BILA